MIRIFALLSVLLFSKVAFAQSNKNAIGGTYVGLWAETIWTYTFSMSNNFVFESRGHFGNTHTVGKYRISGDTVIISAFPKELQVDSSYLAITDTLLLDGDSCIIHYSIGYDYCKLKENQDEIEHSRERRKSRYEFRKPDEL